MRKGFTIIELLVASLLLGMLVTILTMIFNQSSISWRIGVAGVVDMDEVRDNMAEIREEADNLFTHGGKIYRHVGLWDENGDLHYRAASGEGLNFSKVDRENENWQPHLLFKKESQLAAANRSEWNPNVNMLNVNMTKKVGSVKNYTVNVMSGGPANDVNDWQAIWSFPDDPNEW